MVRFPRLLYRFSREEYRQIGEIWNGAQGATGEECEVVDSIPKGAEIPDLAAVPET